MIMHRARVFRGEVLLKRLMFCLWVVLAVLSPVKVFAQVSAYPLGLTEEERILQEAKEQRPPFGVSLGASQTMGASTLNSDQHTRRQSLDMSLSISPYWRLTPLVRLTAGLGTSTALVENYDTGTTKRHQWYLSDLSLGLSHAKLWTIPFIDASVSGGVGLGFPTSLQSQFREVILTSRAGVNVSRSLGPVYLSWGFGFSKNFNRYTSPTGSVEDAGEHVFLSHYKGNEQLTNDLVALGGNNTSFGINNSFLVSWYIFDPLSLSVVYSFAQSWTYRSYEKDELAGKYADEGRGYRDSQSGVVDLSYQFNDVYSVSLGVQTMTSPKTADNKAWIFPFMNFSNNYRANTGIYLAVGAVF